MKKKDLRIIGTFEGSVCNSVIVCNSVTIKGSLHDSAFLLQIGFI